jgi:hypothetical protein
MPNMTLSDCNSISGFRDEFDRIISLDEEQDTLTQCDKRKLQSTFTLRYVIKSTYNQILSKWFRWIM